MENTHSQLSLVGGKPPHPVLGLFKQTNLFFLFLSSSRMCISIGIKGRNVKNEPTVMYMITTGRASKSERFLCVLHTLIPHSLDAV